MKHLIYLHGFNSSPKSEKAQLTQAYFKNSQYEVSVPALPPAPLEAIALVHERINELGVGNVAGFIGSSLGGYYSLFLHSHYSLPAVLINPAIRPYELLVDYLGENTNLYTGETYIVESHHMDDLKSLDVEIEPDCEQLYLLAQTRDEVLDYSQATDKLRACKMWVQFGGDHSFREYSKTLPSIASFFSQ